VSGWRGERTYAGMSEFAQDDEEYDEGRNPRPEFVGVHDFVAE